MSWNGGILCLNVGGGTSYPGKDKVHSAILNAFQEAKRELGVYPRVILLQEYQFQIDMMDTIPADVVIRDLPRTAGFPTMANLFSKLTEIGAGGAWRAVRQGISDPLVKSKSYPVVLFDTDVFEHNSVLQTAIPLFPDPIEGIIDETGFGARTLRNYSGRWSAVHLAVKYSATDCKAHNPDLSTPLQILLISYHGRHNEIRNPEHEGSDRRARELPYEVKLPLSVTFVKHASEFALKQPFHKLADNHLNLRGVPTIVAGDYNIRVPNNSFDSMPGVCIIKHIPKTISRELSVREAPEDGLQKPQIDYAFVTNPLPTKTAQRYAARSGAKAQAPCIVEIGEITELAHLEDHRVLRLFNHNPFVMAFTLTAGAEAATLMPMSQAPIGNIKPIIIPREPVAPAPPPTPSPTQPERIGGASFRADNSSSRQLALEPLLDPESETTVAVPLVEPKAGFFKRVVSIVRAVSFQSASRRSRTTVSASSTAGDEGSLSTNGRGADLDTVPSSHPVLDSDFTSGSSSGSVHVEEADNADAQPASTPGSESRTSVHEEDKEVDVLPDPSPIPEPPRPVVGGAKIELWRRKQYEAYMERTGPNALHPSEMLWFVKPMILDALRVPAPKPGEGDKYLAQNMLFAASRQEWYPAGMGQAFKRDEFNEKVMEHPEIFDNLCRYLAPHL